MVAPLKKQNPIHSLEVHSTLAIEIERRRFSRLVFTRRAVQVIWALAPVILSCWRDVHRYWFFGKPLNRSESHHARRAITLRKKIEHLGVSFIKVGQVLSTRGDLFPKVYIDTLSTLQDSVNPLPFELVRTELEGVYGQSLAAIFDTFSEKPLASASMGQVHRATYAGRDVVVKLVRPGIEPLVWIDYALIQAILNALESQCSRLTASTSDIQAFLRLFRQVVTEVHRGMLEEIDFHHERLNAERLARLLATRPGVKVPQTVPELCHPTVLVLEYLAGTKISELETLRHQGFDPLKLVDQVVELYVEMILVNGVYHGDPHPGNVFVSPRGEIILFDFGIVRELSQAMRDGLLATVLAGVRGEVDGVVDELYRLGILDPAANRETALIVARKIAELHFQGISTADRIETTRRFIRNAFGYLPLHLPQELVYVFRVTSMLEGLGTRVKPGWNMMADGGPAIRRVVGHLLVQHTSVSWLDTVRSWAKRLWDSFFGQSS